MKVLNLKSFLLGALLASIFSFSITTAQAAPFPITAHDKNLCAQFEKHLPKLNGGDGILITTTAANPLSVAAGGSSAPTYTVANNIGQSILITSLAAGVANPAVVSGSITNDNCSGKTIASGSSCTFNVTLTGGSNAGSTTVAPKVGIDCVLSATASPLTVNVTQQQKLPAPTFSPVSGSTIASGSNVTITDANSSATIYYTTDGSTPNHSSSHIASGGSITISQSGTVTVHALASAAGFTDSSVATATYTVTSSGLITAVGHNGDSNIPLLSQSTDNGSTWSTFTASGISTTPFGIYETTNCTPSSGGTSGICIAAGDIQDSFVDSGQPFLSFTNDGGTSWNTPTIPGLGTNGLLRGSSCTGSGTNAQCIASGCVESSATNCDPTSGAQPLIIQTTDGGTSWTIPSISGSSAANGLLVGASCTGSSSTGLCTSVGQSYVASPNTPLLVQSKDGGTTWSAIDNSGISGLGPDDGSFATTSCINNNYCLAAGLDTALSDSLLVQTTDGGSTWTRVVSPAGEIANVSFSSSSCSGSICVVVGQDTSTGDPVIVETQDGGTSWTQVTTGLPSNANLASVSCAALGGTTECVAAGCNGTVCSSPTPLLLIQTTDGGNSWSSTSLSVVSGSTFTSVTCGKASSGDTVCVAGGATPNPSPLLYESVNGSNTWTSQTVSGQPAAGEYFGVGNNF